MTWRTIMLEPILPPCCAASHRKPSYLKTIKICIAFHCSLKPDNREILADKLPTIISVHKPALFLHSDTLFGNTGARMRSFCLGGHKQARTSFRQSMWLPQTILLGITAISCKPVLAKLQKMCKVPAVQNNENKSFYMCAASWWLARISISTCVHVLQWKHKTGGDLIAACNLRLRIRYDTLDTLRLKFRTNYLPKM